MGYTAGTLDLELLGYDSGAVKSIDDTAAALRRLSTSLKRLEGLNITQTGTQIARLFEKIAKATSSIDTTNLDRLANAAKSLSAISRIGNLEKVDYDKVGKGFSNLTTSIAPFVNKVREAEGSLTALYGILQKSSGRKIQGLIVGANKATSPSNRGGIFGAFRLTTTLYVARRLANAVGSIVQAGSDYNETLNLWQVAMRDNLDLADEFVNKMNKAYGISTKTVMQAQATFKNMIGSLGQISDEVAYQLSEAIVQMSADFSSLYNVSLESAFTKMQAMLASQVRPIRSVSGYDITENTLFQFYQQLGGTKTMRQLSRTEKQLLSILAVYQQMGASGALGDMTKTLNTFANQSRMMTEYWAELKTWTGLVLKDLIDQSGALIYINAALITMSEVMKAIAKSRGLGDEDYLTGMFETTEATNDAVDELQGKLLDFDKFRALDEGGENALGIDEKLLEAISGYSSKLEEAESEAAKLAKTWTNWWLDPSRESGLTVQAEIFLETLKFIGIAIGVIFAMGIIGGLKKFVVGLAGVTTASKLLNVVLVSGLIYAIVKAIECFKDGEYWGGILASTIGVVLAGAFIYLNRTAITNLLSTLSTPFINIFAKAAKATGSFGLSITTLTFSVAGLAAAAIGAFAIIKNWGDMATWQKIIGIIGVATTAILGLAMAFGAFHSAWSIGLASAGIVAGIGMIVASIATVKKDAKTPVSFMADGGIPDKGTLFVAGEAGAEIVTNSANGQTGVTNVQQIQQAMYNALVAYGKTQGSNGQAIEVYLDGERVYQNTTEHAKRRGNVWSKA